MNYNNRKFKVIEVSDNGEVDDEMIFHYKQSGAILSCSYSGNDIVRGNLLGLVDAKGIINLRYHQINLSGELLAGICESKPEILANGKIRLHEEWAWISGDQSKGSSILEEI